MKKILLIVAIMAISVTYVAAQDANPGTRNTQFIISLDGGAPFGDNANFYSMIIGGSVAAEYPASGALAITGRTGFHAYTFDKSTVGTTGSFKIIPLLAGIKYYFDKFYLNGEIGAAFSASKGGKTSLMYTPGLGYKAGKLDLKAVFQALSSSGVTINGGVLSIGYSLN